MGGTFRAPVSDAVFARRAYLDLWGVTPTFEQLQAAKGMDRGKLIDTLLADREMFAGHWISFWNDLLRNDQRAYHGDSAKPYTPWLKKALVSNMPYDEMVRLMLAADELRPDDLSQLRATGYLARNYFLFNRNQWMDETVEHVSKGFLGLTMNCAKCHDHKFDPVTMRDYYALAGVFASTQVADRSLLPSPLAEQVTAARKKLDALEENLKKQKDKQSE